MGYEIYNEGRIVGMGSYELYVRQHLSVDPINPPATEREWLASTLSLGQSMILRVEKAPNHKNDEIWMYETLFPANTKLAAANTIIGSYFHGKCEFSGAGWATRVTDYGEMLANTASASPAGQLHNHSAIPTNDVSRWTDEERHQLLQYAKILDGIIIQPGEWVDSTKKPPQKDLIPNMADYPRVRLQIRGPIEEEFAILLSGFTLRAVLKGVAGLDGSTDTEDPEDGDFLGPMQFPWASKIIFSVPTGYMAYYGTPNFTRMLPTGGSSKTVNETTVIDMLSTDPGDYYKTRHTDARVPMNVQAFTDTGEGSAVLAVYSRSELFPPALWGAFVSQNGDQYMNPIDCVAPGTIKVIPNGTAAQLAEYQKLYPGTIAMSKSNDGKLSVIDQTGKLVTVGGITVQPISYTNPGGSARKAQMVITESGEDKSMVLSLSPGKQGVQYTITTSPINEIPAPADDVTWSALLEALSNDKAVDVLGSDLKRVKHGLPRNYIAFPNGLRLYVSSTRPTDTDVPVGSIGIGW